MTILKFVLLHSVAQILYLSNKVNVKESVRVMYVLCSCPEELCLKARTNTPILARSGQELVVESANSITKTADLISTTDSVIIGRLSESNMFDILNQLESADRKLAQ